MPPSRSSAETTADLISHERRTAWAMASVSHARNALMLVSIQAKKSGSAIAPCLMTSAKPAESSRAGSVRSVFKSAITATGWWNAPIIFLPSGWLIPVLPPTEESTWANKVVGTWINRMPRIKLAAPNPAISPTTPPPSAMIMLWRSAPCASSSSKISCKCCQSLNDSPSGNSSRCTVLPSWLRVSVSFFAYNGATVVLLTIKIVVLVLRWGSNNAACSINWVPI